MSKTARRILIPVFISAVALGIVVLVMFNPRNRPAPQAQGPTEQETSQEETDDDASGVAEVDDPPGRDADQAQEEDQAPTEQGGEEEETEVVVPQPAAPISLTGLRAAAPAPGVTLDDNNRPESIGSLDWREHRFLIEFSPAGAGIERITFNNIWETADAKRRAADIMERVENGSMTLAQAIQALPGNLRYVIQRPRTINIRGQAWEIPAFAIDRIVVDSPDGDPQIIYLWTGNWSQEGPVGAARDEITFLTEIANETGEPALRIRRTFRISSAAAYDLVVEQSIENVAGVPVDVTLYTYGMSDLDRDRAQYIDIRRYRIGHLMDTVLYPQRQWIETDGDFFLDRSKVLERGEGNYLSASPAWALWPTADSIERNYEISWFAEENRYFAVAVHPPHEGGAVPTSIASVIEGIDPFSDGQHDNAVLMLRSPRTVLPAGESITLDFGIYAGPLDRSILTNHEPYETLKMGRLIFYQISSWCAWCTFQWLAVLLLWFLSLVHSVLFDWAVAIILLVVVVRILLHPITKKGQVSMQRFGKVMQKLKPDIEKLQEKYKGDPKRLQQEQMKLWREYGVSPFSCLGFLPLFLQMPIWIALYAMLYFAWELRHEAAFWGVFQVFWDWPFLGDLSSGDHFFYEFKDPVQFIWWTVTGINLLPLLMGVIFWIQQKYMTPQTGTLSPEQKQMQTMMRIMTVFLFPIMLYTAPSGLTLYIMTSSIWGILESRRIRKHVEQMEIEKPIERKSLDERMAMKAKTKGKDPYARAWQMAMDRAKAKREAKEKKSFKKRK